MQSIGEYARAKESVNQSRQSSALYRAPRKVLAGIVAGRRSAMKAGRTRHATRCGRSSIGFRLAENDEHRRSRTDTYKERGPTATHDSHTLSTTRHPSSSSCFEISQATC